jgi:hypothetical protein
MGYHGYLDSVLGIMGSHRKWSWVIMGIWVVSWVSWVLLGSVLDHGFSWDRFWYQGFLGFSRLSLISMSSRILG